MTTFTGQIYPRAGTAATWASSTRDDFKPGEVLWEVDTGKVKYGRGNGETFAELPYEPFRGRTPAASEVSYAGHVGLGIDAGTVETGIDGVASALVAHAAEVGPGAHLADAPVDTPDDYVFRADGTWGAQAGGGGPANAAALPFTPNGNIAAENTQAAVVEVRDDAAAALSPVAANASNALSAAGAAGTAVTNHAATRGAGAHLPDGGAQHAVPMRTGTPGEVVWALMIALRVGFTPPAGMTAADVQTALTEVITGATATIDWDPTLNAGNGAWFVKAGNPETAALRRWRGPVEPVLTPEDPLADLWEIGDDFTNRATV